MMSICYHIDQEPGKHCIEVESITNGLIPFSVLRIGDITVFASESQLLDIKIAIDDHISRSVESDAILNPAEVLALKAA